MEALLDVELRETNSSALEGALHALTGAAHGSHRVNWEWLIAKLGPLDLVVQPHELANRCGPSWQVCRMALERLGLPDFFDVSSTKDQVPS
jgi:hypothetical protein